MCIFVVIFIVVLYGLGFFSSPVQIKIGILGFTHLHTQRVNLMLDLGDIISSVWPNFL